MSGMIVAQAPRVAQWVTRATPEVIEVVAREVSKKQGLAVVMTTGRQLIEFASSNKVKATLVATTVAQLGYEAYDWFTGGKSKIEPSADGGYTDAAEAAVDKGAHLKLSLGDTEDAKLARDVLRFVRSAFLVRNVEELARVHLMLRTFSELSTQQVRQIGELYFRN